MGNGNDLCMAKIELNVICSLGFTHTVPHGIVGGGWGGGGGIEAFIQCSSYKIRFMFFISLSRAESIVDASILFSKCRH